MLLKNNNNHQKVYISALQKEIEVNRIIGQLLGKKGSPTLVFIAGIHGNETSGIYAIKKVLNSIKEQGIPVSGNIFAICGNMGALKKGIRFEEVDLNRVWTRRQLKKINSKKTPLFFEEKEQMALYGIIKTILTEENGPFIFIDMHSTSAETKPFITISDSLNNRKFSKSIPVPIVLGIEEYLDGTLLSYINEHGHVALGFEAGQHDDIQAIDNCEAFIWLCLVNSKCIPNKKSKKYIKSKKLLHKISDLEGKFFEIDYRQSISSNDAFSMKANFLNFDSINKDQKLATLNKQQVYAPFKGRIFMPLYQNQGDDGFFIVARISSFWLGISKFLRKLNFYHFLRILPGIRQHKHDKNILIVNEKTAKIMATELFHLLGYRKKISKKGSWLFFKRDKKIKRLE